MGKNNGLSHDQKRKAKLKKRADRSRNTQSLAYAGSKYKSDKFAMLFFRTEIGIYESYVILDGELTDADVVGAIESLVLKLREGPQSPLPESGELTVTRGEEEELIIENIRRNWRIMAEKQSLPSRDDLVGVLRTILSSIETWHSKSLHAQGYLRYLEGFLMKRGVSVRKMPADPVRRLELESDT